MKYVLGAVSAALPALSVIATASLLAGAGSAVAADDRLVEEIVVTARKREETLQDVPFAVQAITGDDLKQRGAESLEDAANNIAGFTVQNLGPGQSQVAIRGISAGQIVRDQPGVKEQVGVYLDESVISLSLFTPDLDFYDMNRVEVLRGPQGTLYGSGSLSGTVKYVSNQPQLQTSEGSYSVGFKQIAGGGFGNETKGMVNLPHGNKFALRLVGYNTEYGGWIDAIQPGEFTVKDVNNGSRGGVRASLKWVPTHWATITPRVIFQNVNMNGFNREDRFNTLANEFTTTRPQVSLRENEQYTQLKENFVDEFMLTDLNVTLDLDAVTLTSISSYTDRNVLVLRDASALTLGVIGLIGESSLGLDADTVDTAIEALSGPLYDRTEVQMFTQELRLSGSNDAIDWVTGLFYSDIDRAYAQDLPVRGFEAITGVETEGQINPTDSLFFSQIPYNFKQKAVFGEITWHATEAFEISAGARWYDFEETRVLNFDGIFANQSIGVPGKTASDGINPRLMMAYDFTPSTTMNAQVSRGFRLGGINDPLNTGACSQEDFDTFSPFQNSFDDEELTNYEVGVKSGILGGRGTLNASVFHSDIENLQVTLDAGTCSSRLVFPVKDATATGIEFELDANVSRVVNISAAGSYVDTEIGSTLTSDGAVLGGVRKGNRFATTPELQLAVAATFDFNWNNNWGGYAVLSVQHVGSRYTQLADQEPGAGTTDPSATGIGDAPSSTVYVNPEMDAYQLVNLRIGGRSGAWELAGYINNLTDERVIQSFDRELGGVGRFGYRVGQPMSIGSSLSYYFE